MLLLGYFLIPISVVDPNTLNLDQDPEFWPNLYPDQGLFFINFEDKNNLKLV